ncbi:MAG: hypothetical protein ACE5GY_01470 [Thermodesulfobacteriota bacterium]
MLLKDNGLSMTDGYNAERLALFDSLIKKKLGVSNGRFWTLEPREMRFRHGETIAELKIPYHMGGDDEAVIEGAVQSLLVLLSRRFESAGMEPRGESDAQHINVSVPPLKEKTFRTDIFISESIEQKLATTILSCSAFMDSSILSSWLGTDGHGRRFIRWIGGIFEKALKDEARHGGEEKTSYLLLLAALNTIRKKKDAVKGCRIKGISYEKVDLTVGLTLFLTFKEALGGLLERLKESDATCYTPQAHALLCSALVPRAFLSIPSNILSSTLNPYGINQEIFDAVAKLAPGADGAQGTAELIDEATRLVRRDSRTVSGIKEQYDIVRFRQEAMVYLHEFDIPGNEAQNRLYEMYNDDRLIRNFINDSRACASLSAGLEEVKKRYAARDARRMEIITGFQEYISGFNKPSFLGGLLKGSRKEAEHITPAIEGYYACLLDDNVEAYERLMRGYLVDRRGEFEQNTLIEEYNRGRLYRFSNDERAILKTLTLEEEGQLFIDMKDFTRKTLKVKEIAMAEFMKEYFYKPILLAASKYRMGTGVETDERGIKLTNLPGDAAIFSGGITYLVSLARDIQHVIRKYREQLLMRLPPRKDEEILDEVHKTFEQRRDELRHRRAELDKAIENKEPRVEHRLVALGEEEYRLENTYRDELENAIKGELEAGLYLSYGAKAETMLIEPREGFTGSVKVAIGEKINEAARGTFRNHLVRAKLELMLEKAKVKRKKKLKYPFDIYIDRIYSVKMPPEIERAFEKLIMSRKSTSAQAMTQVMANEFFNDLKKIISGDPFSNLRVISTTTDIYNKGQAISRNALDSYMKETKGSKFFFHKSVAASELDQSIRDTFFFPYDTLEFWFGVESMKGGERVEGFYMNGEVIFKGFEANTPTVIYEILDTEGDFFRALLKHHFERWHEEARKASLQEGL